MIVTESLTYGGRSGRVSAKATAINIGAMNWNQSFTWDELGNLGSESYPACTHANCTATAAGSPTQSYGYTRGLLTSIPGYATVGYHLNGLPATISHQNGVLDTVANDAKERPRPASITTTGGSRNWPSGVYSYDAAGNVYAMGTDYFLYDNLSRITTSRLHDQPYDGGTEKKQSYSYDRYGNLLDMTTQVGTGTPVTRTNATVATTNRLSAAGYDLAGNVTSWQGQSYGYDPFDSMRYGPNRVLIYGPGDERLWEFAFTNAADVGTWVETFTLRGLDGKVKREYRAAGGTGAGNWQIHRDHLHRGGEILATVLPQLGATYHYSLDHLGTPRLVTDQNDIKIAQHTYYPYGEEATSPSQDGERMKFTGHERDFQGAGTTDDLDYMHARYCSPMTGRFMSLDAVNSKPRVPQSWNRYAYGRGNPMKFVDPDGRDVFLANRPVQDLVASVANSHHAFIVIKPSKENLERFSGKINKCGVIVLGGYQGANPKGGPVLESLISARSDASAYDRGNVQLINVQPENQTTQQFEINVVEAFESYESRSIAYGPLDLDGKNSNAFASGVLAAAGAGEAAPDSGDLDGFNPGFDDPLELPDATQNDAEPP